MFMNHVEKLVWRGHDGTGEWFRCGRCDGVLVLERGKIVNDQCLAPTSSSYRVFSSPVTLPDSTCSMIRIAFRLDAQGKVVAEDRPMKLWVFFETEEPTGLRFRVHGPFDLTDNRANIKRHDAFNRRLINEIGDLAAKALSILRDEGRLHRPALEVVPSPSDDIPEGWQAVAERLWKHLQTEPMLPKQAGGFGTAGELYLGLEEVRQSISDSDLAFLLSKPGGAWSVPAGIKNSRLERMLHHVGVKDFGLPELYETLWKCYAVRESELAQWLSKHDDEWVQRLYQLLTGLKRSELSMLGYLPLVRTASSSHVRAGEARMPPPEGIKEGGLQVRGVTMVSPGVLSGGKNKERREAALECLKGLGVKTLGEQDYIQALLDQHYTAKTVVTDLKTHKAHMGRFLAWWSQHANAAMFRDYHLFLSDDTTLYTARELFIDKPFRDTALIAVYGPTAPCAGMQKPLSRVYRDIQGIVDFVSALGGMTSLKIESSSTWNHPERGYLRQDFYQHGTRWGDSTDIDWRLPDFDQLVAKQDIAVALCIWRTASALKRDHLFAHFRHARSYPMRERPSSLVLQLKSAAWLPDKQGVFRKPEDLTQDDLSTDFKIVNDTGWLETIGFGAVERRRSVAFQEKRQAAVTAGIPEELVESWMRLPPNVQRELVARAIRDAEATTAFPEFPDRDSPNPSRRAMKVAEAAQNAPEKKREIRERTMRLEVAGHRQEVRAYLRDLYTNAAHQMICQCCRQAMPFKLLDGETPYFEAVEFLKECSHELVENYVALCPVCAAKFQHARATTDEELRAALAVTSVDNVPVRLAGTDEAIRFVRQHWDDLVATLSATLPTLSSLQRAGVDDPTRSANCA
jgi:hypothetical protein